MPIFITQGFYTREAIKGMIVKPEDHADAVGRIMSKAGGRQSGADLQIGRRDLI